MAQSKKKRPPSKRRVGQPEKYTVPQIVQAIEKNKGFVYLTAKSLGCHHSTLRDYREKYPEIEQAFRVQRGEMVDTAELSLYNSVLKGEAWAVCFILKTQGKDRGYVEKQEFNHTHAGQIDFAVFAELPKETPDEIAAELERRAKALPQPSDNGSA